MRTCTREQGKLRLTILQTLHVGGVFSKCTLHHARDVREGAGKGSLSWHNMWNALESKVHQPGGCPWAARDPAKGEVLVGKPGGVHMEWDSHPWQVW